MYFFSKLENFVEERIDLNSQTLLEHPPLHVPVIFSIGVFLTTFCASDFEQWNAFKYYVFGYFSDYEHGDCEHCLPVSLAGGGGGEAGRVGTCLVVNRGTW